MSSAFFKLPIFLNFKQVLHPTYGWIGTRVPQVSIFCALNRYSYIISEKQFLWVPPKSLYKKLLIGTKLYLSVRMSSSSMAPKGLKDYECKKGHLGNHPPIPYIPPTDLLQAKDNTEMLKVKLPDASVFSMTIFAKGSPEDYLQHVIVILRLTNQKGLDTLIVLHNKEMKLASAVYWACRFEFQQGPGSLQEQEGSSEAQESSYPKDAHDGHQGVQWGCSGYIWAAM